MPARLLVGWLTRVLAGWLAGWFAGLVGCYFLPLRFALFSSCVLPLGDNNEFIIYCGFINHCRKVLEGQ